MTTRDEEHAGGHPGAAVVKAVIALARSMKLNVGQAGGAAGTNYA
jgi:hypothetical protein